MKKTKFCVWIFLVSLAALQPLMALAEADLSKLELASGFHIAIYAEGVANARSLTLGDDGTVYVGTRTEGKVYALPDADGDGQVDRVITVASGLNMPNGVAYYQGDLYVAEIQRIIRYKNIAATRDRSPRSEVVYDWFPKDAHHGWKYLRVGPYGKLYTAVGGPCNICLRKDEIYATLVRLNPDGSDFEIYAHGIRNTVGFDWHPETKELWFNDNGRDWLGDDVPPDELNHAAKPDQHFGFPYCHAGTIPDPEYGKEKNCQRFVAPAWRYPAHVAPLGMRFYTGQQFPAAYRHQLFVAQHGSWNRSVPQGYRIVVIKFDKDRPVAEDVFAHGWLPKQGRVWGRPVDILQMPDGALLVSDDLGGRIYRISYGGK